MSTAVQPDDRVADYLEMQRTGPGTLAGRYMRLFWHPVHRSDLLPSGRAKPIRIMSEDFTLYRGEGGAVHLAAFRCAHRGTQLSTGWVEGENLRCFYHGWVYGPDGQCIEQPAEPEPFCQRVNIRSYPVREYLGLIFAYLGEGEPPVFPRYLELEDPDRLVAPEAYVRNANFWSNLDNTFDPAHFPFVHNLRKAPPPRTPGEIGYPEETDWGVVRRIVDLDGTVRFSHFGMPSIRYAAWGRRLEFHVPIDDRSYVAFNILSARLSEEAERIRRNPKPGRDDPEFHQYVVEQATAILEGRRTVDEVTTALIDQPDAQGGIVSPVLDPRDQPIQDWVAQVGQMGPESLLDPQDWHLGRADIGLTFKREIWRRELRALAEGRPLKQWRPLPPDWNEVEAVQRQARS